MNPARLPIACELFAQWQRSRGDRAEPAKQPFTRSWSELLESAGMRSAIEESDAERDARALAIAGWVNLKNVRYFAHRIARISIPLAMEDRWCDAFGFTRTSDDEARRIREFPWVPALAFLAEARTNIPFVDLLRLHDFLISDRAALDTIPIKERSLEIFGDEKRLDLMQGCSLFRAGRLDLTRDLRCEIIGVPLAWKRGPAAAAHHPLIVIENAATWHSYCRWNSEHAHFSAVIYGDGNRFADGIRYLADIFSELGGTRPIFYFGDLDPQGLLIPQEASARATALGFPRVEPHLESYATLLRIGANREQPWEGEPASSTLCDWLGELGHAAQQIFAARKRLAQEHLGWDVLCRVDYLAPRQAKQCEIQPIIPPASKSSE